MLVADCGSTTSHTLRFKKKRIKKYKKENKKITKRCTGCVPADFFSVCLTFSFAIVLFLSSALQVRTLELCVIEYE